MGSIQDAINTFRNAVYGKDVRAALVDVAEAVAGQVINLDTGLTQSGYAADAKAVGDRFATVNSSIATNRDNIQANSGQIGTINQTLAQHNSAIATNRDNIQANSGQISTINQTIASMDTSFSEEIDEVLDLIVPEYSSDETYEIGEFCRKDNVLYQCTTRAVAEAWNALHWNATTVGEALNISGLVTAYYDRQGTYAVGDYVIYDGGMYRCKKAHSASGSWVAANWDPVTVTEEIGNMFGTLADDYSVTNTYEIGDYVVYGGKLYRCNVRAVTENWTAAHWDEVQIQSMLRALRDEIDARLSADEATIASLMENTVASVFSATKAYSAGDYAVYNGKLYRFTADHAAGAWVGTDATAIVLGDDVGDLKSAINDVYIPSDNIYNQDTDRHGIAIDGRGNITENASLKASDYIYVGAGNKVTLQVVSGQQRIYFYTANDESGFSRTLWITGSGSETFTLASAENYIVITMRETVPDFMVNLGDTLLPYAPYGGDAGTFLQSVIDDINDTISAETESVRKTSAQKEIVNLFNKSTITPGKYISVNDGSLSTNEAFFASDFIYIGDLASVTVSYTHIFVWYDENKNHLTPNPDPMNSGSQDLTFTRPEGAMYLRFSAYNTNINSAQIGWNVSRNNYVLYGIYKLPELRINESQIEVSDESGIVVDASGAGDYTSFTQAIYDTVNSGIDVYVKAGTYNIVSEYVALFGQSAVDNMADADSAIFNGFQYGVRIRNRKVEFASGAHLVCDWTGHTVDGTHRFSALGIDYNCEIIGLDLDCTATFYCIHDDYGISDPYTVKYENCRVVGHNIYNANCIGGGCKKYSRHILNNCYFNNNLTESATVRYHNTNAEGAEPEIYVSNCYFNNWFTPRWYGTQTSKMKVYVNNCEARSIHKLAESASYNVDNVDLYKWCNTETNPVT